MKEFWTFELRYIFNSINALKKSRILEFDYIILTSKIKPVKTMYRYQMKSWKPLILLTSVSEWNFIAKLLKFSFRWYFALFRAIDASIAMKDDVDTYCTSDCAQLRIFVKFVSRMVFLLIHDVYFPVSSVQCFR